MSVPQITTPDGEDTPDRAAQQTTSGNERVQAQASPSSPTEGIQGPAMLTLPTFSYRDWVRLQELRGQFEGVAGLPTEAGSSQAPASRLLTYHDWVEYQRLRERYEASIVMLGAGPQGRLRLMRRERRGQDARSVRTTVMSKAVLVSEGLRTVSSD